MPALPSRVRVGPQGDDLSAGLAAGRLVRVVVRVSRLDDEDAALAVVERPAQDVGGERDHLFAVLALRLLSGQRLAVLAGALAAVTAVSKPVPVRGSIFMNRSRNTCSA